MSELDFSITMDTDVYAETVAEALAYASFDDVKEFARLMIGSIYEKSPDAALAQLFVAAATDELRTLLTTDGDDGEDVNGEAEAEDEEEEAEAGEDGASAAPSA